MESLGRILCSLSLSGIKSHSHYTKMNGIPPRKFVASGASFYENAVTSQAPRIAAAVTTFMMGPDRILGICLYDVHVIFVSNVVSRLPPLRRGMVT